MAGVNWGKVLTIHRNGQQYTGEQLNVAIKEPMDQSTSIHQIGFIGVGRMGGPMAQNLQRAGFVVRAYDISPAAREAASQAGLTLATSPAQTAGDADAIILMLPSDEALREVMDGADGLLSRLQPGQVVIDMATSLLATSQRLAAQAAERGAALIDAPVSGGEEGARAGTLSIMAGGAPDVIERCRPVLAAMGSTITHIGGQGLGLIAKYVNQIIMEAAFCAVAEAFAVAAKAGADLEAVYQAVRNGLGGSRVLDLMLPQLLSGDLGSGRELTLHYKDGGYALAVGDALGAWTPLTALTHELFAQAMAMGQDGHHASGVARVYEQKMGVQMVNEGKAI
jgi:2-hydroxy-3-oxopropionate reductase